MDDLRSFGELEKDFLDKLFDMKSVKNERYFSMYEFLLDYYFYPDGLVSMKLKEEPIKNDLEFQVGKIRTAFLSFKYNLEESNENMQAGRRVVFDLIEIFNLMEYCIDKGLLIEFAYYKAPKFQTGNQYISTLQLPENITDLIWNHINTSFYVTNELISLKKRNYISRNEQRFRDSMSLSVIGISIASLIGLIGLILGIANLI